MWSYYILYCIARKEKRVVYCLSDWCRHLENTGIYTCATCAVRNHQIHTYIHMYIWIKCYIDTREETRKFPRTCEEVVSRQVVTCIELSCICVCVSARDFFFMRLFELWRWSFSSRHAFFVGIVRPGFLLYKGKKLASAHARRGSQQNTHRHIYTHIHWGKPLSRVLYTTKPHHWYFPTVYPQYKTL